MKELVLKIKFDDEGCYKGHGDDISELIEEGIKQFLEIELESDGVIKEGWTVEVVSSTNLLNSKQINMTTENLIKIKSDAGVQLTDRELAVRWWGRLSTTEQEEVISNSNLTIRPIDYDTMYWLWLKKQKID